MNFAHIHFLNSNNASFFKLGQPDVGVVIAVPFALFLVQAYLLDDQEYKQVFVPTGVVKMIVGGLIRTRRTSTNTVQESTVFNHVFLSLTVDNNEVACEIIFSLSPVETTSSSSLMA